MDSQVYILVSIAVLAVVCALVFFTGRGERRNRLTPLPVSPSRLSWPGFCSAKTEWSVTG